MMAGDTRRGVGEEIEAEVGRLISYLNDKVVPEVRQGASIALRVASEKLGRMAEHLEGGAQTRQGGAARRAPQGANP